MNFWSLIVFLGIIVSSLHAEISVLVEEDQFLSLEYKKSTARPDTMAASVLIGIPPSGSADITEIRIFDSDNHPLYGIDWAPFIRINDEGMLRRQQVMRLAIDKSFLTMADRIEIDIHFSVSVVTDVKDTMAEALYRSILVNPKQSSKWRLPRPDNFVSKPVQDFETTWLRIGVRDSGIFRVTGQDLVEAGVPLDNIEAKTFRLFYGGGRPLYRNRPSVPIRREEVGLVVEDGGDGSFDNEDFVLFYGEAAERWVYNEEEKSFEWLSNEYTSYNSFWLGFGGINGLREERLSVNSRGSGTINPKSYRVRVHLEDEQFVLYQTYGIKSGYTWYAEDFRGNARNFRFLITDPITDPVDMRFGFIGIGKNRPRFNVKWNGDDVGEIVFKTNRFIEKQIVSEVGPIEGLNELGLFHSGDPTRLNWLEVEYSRGFTAERGLLDFFSPQIDSPAEYTLSGFLGEKPRIFEVSSKLAEVVDFEFDIDTGGVTFLDEGRSKPGHFVVGASETWKSPSKIELDTPSDLLSRNNEADYIVIYHGDFDRAANRLANWRATDDSWGTPPITMAIDIQDVYDEFSGGMLDPAALRNFLSFAESSWRRPPMYICLLGDGSYDYKNNSGTSLGNWIPPYQDGDSTFEEWFVCILGDDDIPDMAIGRLPVKSAIDADRLVDKIIRYDSEAEVGSWQGRVLLIADDISNPDKPSDTEPYFVYDSEYMTNFFPEEMDIEKLYLGLFPLEGQGKPRARDEFIRRFNEGALLVTYLGHGNPDVLAHEQMFRVSRDLNEINNGRRLPLFYTAASQVGVFDDPVKTSMPEELLNLADGGVIGMISATRVGYHMSNVVLAEAFHDRMYRSGREGVPVGLALMEAKPIALERLDVEDATSVRNIRRYSLFGDPFQRMALPRFRVILNVQEPMQALGLVKIDGKVVDENGMLVTDYNGSVRIRAFDSSELSLLDGVRYRQVGADLFRGLYSVNSGVFSAQFRVPKDITYGGNNGRVSAFAWDEEGRAAFGDIENLDIAGTASNVEPDIEGPTIRINFEGNESFKSGDKILGIPLLQVNIFDYSGLNITGETGHEIELFLDNDESIKLTDRFNVEGGDYREGVLEYRILGLEVGTHVLALKAWDTHNNSSRVEVNFEVIQSDDKIIQNALFYPNPLEGEMGYFTYTSEIDAEVSQIKIFTVDGNLIEVLDSGYSKGFNQVEWRKPANISNGTYIYKIELIDNSRVVAVHSGPLQVAR
tara:strand:+ start:1464 stop:5156 length:3693 start_codon:yes stop_codon:yes gene_type:complete